MFDVTYELDYENDYPVLFNDPEMTAFAASALQAYRLARVAAVEQCEAQPPSEDFILCEGTPKRLPLCRSDAERRRSLSHHHPKFRINEDSMLIAAETMGTLVIDYLKGSSEK